MHVANEGEAPVPRTYRITVRGHLSERFVSAFDGFAVELGPGEATLVGVIVDQSHLHGILGQLRDLGIELLRIDSER
jgi:hypothetical protein